MFEGNIWLRLKLFFFSFFFERGIDMYGLGLRHGNFYQEKDWV